MKSEFTWQLGNTTRFIKFKDITSFSYESGVAACGNTLCLIPVTEIDRFEAEYKEWEMYKDD